MDSLQPGRSNQKQLRRTPHVKRRRYFDGPRPNPDNNASPTHLGHALHSFPWEAAAQVLAQTQVLKGSFARTVLAANKTSFGTPQRPRGSETWQPTQSPQLRSLNVSLGVQTNDASVFYNC